VPETPRSQRVFIVHFALHQPVPQIMSISVGGRSATIFSRLYIVLSLPAAKNIGFCQIIQRSSSEPLDNSVIK